jgi:hypothetical protein
MSESLQSYSEQVEAAEEHIKQANFMLANPSSGSPEHAQTEATLAVAHAVLAAARAIHVK